MWRKLIKEMPPRLDIRTLQLPSSAPVATSQLGDLYDDAAAIRAAVDKVGRPCVVVAHSYGSVPTTQALPGAETVRRVVYISGWQLDVGDSVLDQIGGKPLEWMPEQEGGWYDMTAPREIFFSDLSEEDAAAAAAELGPQSVSSFTQTLTQAVWRTSIPTTHIYSEGEVMAPLFKGYAERGADQVRTLPGDGHSPFLARPAQLAAMILEELEEAVQSD
jgi:pimeloyl-ACP methyl ester carboxylesterase